MRPLEGLQDQFQSYVWKHVLSMLLGLMLLKETKTLSALQYQESLPPLSRTLDERFTEFSQTHGVGSSSKA